MRNQKGLILIGDPSERDLSGMFYAQNIDNASQEASIQGFKGSSHSRTR